MSGIEDYKKSMEKAKDNLIDDLSKREFIVFAGTGVSETTGVKLWEKILVDLDNKQSDRYDKLDIGRWDSYEYPELAQILYGRYARLSETSRYYGIIEDNIKSTKEDSSKAQSLILNLSQRIITTNYDDTFEKAFAEKKVDIIQQTLPYLEYDKIAENSITYLHGNFSNDGQPNIIFKIEDYVKYYPMLLGASEESCVEEILKNTYYSKTALVFWGFSFGDRFIEKTLLRLSEEIKKKAYTKGKGDGSTLQLTIDDICHYALMPYTHFDKEELLPKHEKEDEKRKGEQLEKLKEEQSLNKKLKSMGINVVRQEMYKDIIPLLEKIDEDRNEIKREMENLIKPMDEAFC